MAAGGNLERPWGEHSLASFPLIFPLGRSGGANVGRTWGEHSPASFPLIFYWGEVDTSSILYIYSLSAASPQPPPATSSPTAARGKPFIVGGRGGPL